MGQEVFDNCPVRVVRDEDAGAYFVQVGIDGVYRNMSGFKLGKLDQLRAQQAAAQSQPTQPPPAQPSQ